MKCPVCNVALTMSDRQGIEIDYCPQCRGAWLDRGELDKIIERSASYQQGEDRGRSQYKGEYGVIWSDDLEISSSVFRLQYRGSVDLESRVNARVEAGLLRDMWLVGPLVSSIFWPVTKLFEYRVSGSLTEPKSVPVYFLPKLVLVPLHPFRTLKNLFPGDTSPARTNAPPGMSPGPTQLTADLS